MAPILAAAWALRGLFPSISSRGGASMSSGLTDPASMAPSPLFAIGLRPVGPCRLEETCGRIGTLWVSQTKFILFT